jgi:hypothetical protein
MTSLEGFVRQLRRVIVEALLCKDFDGSVLDVRAVLVEILVENSRRLKTVAIIGVQRRPQPIPGALRRG